MNRKAQPRARAALAAALLASVWLAPSAMADRQSRRTLVVKAVEKVAPGVANISTEQVVLQRYNDPFWNSRDRFFGDMFEGFFGRYRRAKVATPLGSGVVIDSDGYIVTNEHVISRASTLKVRLQGDRVYEAVLVSSDPEQDLAVIKIDDTKPLPFIPMGTSKDLMAGEAVIAIGNPFGYESSVTTGVLSATRREVKIPTAKGDLVYRDLIQTDALINPGNSGGPLVNLDGELIGVNTAIRTDAQGIGFAIPVDIVKEALASLFSFETIKNLWFGAKFEPLPGDRDGIVVRGIDGGGPAEKAGLQPGDVVVQVDQVVVHDLFEFEKYLFKRAVGTTVAVHVLRKGRARTHRVALEPVPKPSGIRLAKTRLGLTVQTLTPELARRVRLPVERGILVLNVDPDGAGAEAQLRVGDVVVQIGRYHIRNVDELGVLLDAAEAGRALRVIFVRDGRSVWQTRVQVR